MFRFELEPIVCAHRIRSFLESKIIIVVTFACELLVVVATAAAVLEVLTLCGFACISLSITQSDGIHALKFLLIAVHFPKCAEPQYFPTIYLVSSVLISFDLDLSSLSIIFISRLHHLFPSYPSSNFVCLICL